MNLKTSAWKGKQLLSNYCCLIISFCRFEYFENEKNTYLDSSGNSFEKAISLYEIEDPNEPDERWLQYYILGKIAEKKQMEPQEYLQYYITVRFFNYFIR